MHSTPLRLPFTQPAQERSTIGSKYEPMGGRKGFTILELLFVLVVVSIFAAIAMPKYFGRPEITLENASVLLAHDLRAAQNRSAYMAEQAHFTFLEDGDGYRVLNGDDELVQNPTTDLAFVRSYSEDAVFRGVRITHVDCGGDRVLGYNERGRATEAATITLEFAGDVRVVRVAKGSGSVTIEGSSSGWVDRGY